jgi:Ni,Fe-hydrogenase I cytochrome b subunit
MEPPGYHYDSGLKHLPLILLSAFATSITANGISLMMGASFLVGLTGSVVLSGLKLYFLLRYEPRYEQRVPNRRDKVLGYVALAILLAILGAFGLYGQISASAPTAPHTIEAAGNGVTLMAFFKATLAKSTAAISCWFLAIVVEAIVLIIVTRDHREYEYLAE